MCKVDLWPKKKNCKTLTKNLCISKLKEAKKEPEQSNNRLKKPKNLNRIK